MCVYMYLEALDVVVAQPQLLQVLQAGDPVDGSDVVPAGGLDGGVGTRT
jgi:hypothetical protein